MHKPADQEAALGAGRGGPDPMSDLPLPSPLRPIGRFAPTDADGALIRDASWAQVPEAWRPLALALRDLYLDHCGHNLHSVYLRGSVPRGLAIPGVSDLDSFALVHDRAAQDTSWTEQASVALGAAYPFCAGVEVLVLGVDAALAAPGWVLTLATQAVCLHGEDLLPRLPRLRPGRDLRVFLPRLDRDLRVAARDLDEGEAVDEICRWICKRILRAGLERFLEEEGAWSRDLWLCYDVFARHCPERAAPMLETLRLAVEPTRDRAALQALLDGHGRWLADQAGSP